MDFFRMNEDKAFDIIDNKQWVYLLSKIIIAYSEAKSASEIRDINQLFEALFAGKFASSILFLESIKNALEQTGLDVAEINQTIQAISEAITYNMASMFAKKRRDLASKIKIANAQYRDKNILLSPKVPEIRQKIRNALNQKRLKILDPHGQIIEDYDKVINIIQRVNIAIAIPSYMEGDDIKYPTRKMFLGLMKYFSKEETTLLGNFYHAIPENTAQSFENEVKRLLVEHKETNIYTLMMSTGLDDQRNIIKGKGNNLRNFFELLWLARNTRALKGAAVVDADLKTIIHQNQERGITELWVKRLLYPIVYPEQCGLKHAAEFVSPLYPRHEYDGSLTNNFIVAFYMFITGIFVRQPIGGDFGFAPKALKKFLFDMQWCEETRKYGIDISMSLTVALHKLRIVESALGDKIHDPSTHKLPHLIPEVFGAVAKLLINNQQYWALKSRNRKRKKIGQLERPLSNKKNTDYIFYREKFLRYFGQDTKNINLTNSLLTKEQIWDLAKVFGIEKLLANKLH